MKVLLLLSLLLSLLIPFQSQTATTEAGLPMEVTSYKWSRARRTPLVPEPEGNTPVRAVIPQNKIFARNARVNDPAGARDPNSDTLDGRSAALDKAIAESRAPQAQPVDGFAYRIKVKNVTKKA